MKPEIWVDVHDLHFDKYSEKLWRNVLRFVKDVKPQGFIFGGDQFDNAEISHHNKSKPIYKPTGSYRKNTVRFEREILGPLEKVLPKKAQRVWIIGNHDYWEYEFIEGHPEFAGLVDRATELGLHKRGWEIIPLGHAKKLGHLNIIHGEILTGYGGAGMYPARKAIELYGDNVLAGHTHAPQSFCRVSPVERKKKHMGWIAPILGETNPSYLENRPTAWMQGFTVIEFHHHGHFNLYPIIAFDGRFSYGGKSYGS